VLCKIVAHNICSCIAAWYELDIAPVFTTCTNNEEAAQIIRFPGA
jgi:hypothetical protein